MQRHFTGILTLLSSLATAPAAQPAAPPSDTSEPNDSFAAAKRLGLPALGEHGCIEPAGDVDYFVVHLERAGPLYAGVKGPQVGQFKVSIYDSYHALLGSGFDGADLPRLPAGDYYVSVTSARKGCYELNAYSDAQPPPLP